MKKIISVNDWEIDSLNVVAEYNDDKLRIINNNATSISFRCKKNLHFKEVIDGKLLVKFNGECCNSGGYLILNNNIKLPINSESSIYVKFPSIISLDLVVAAESEITISNIDFEFYESCDLVDKLDVKNDVLVIVPDYPSYVNLYSCAFAHSRNREYVKAGLKVQVVAVNNSNWFQTMYEINDVSVLKCTYKDLKKLLSMNHYKVIVTHFVDEYLYPIFDGNVYNNQKLIFICHGPETVYKYLVNKTRPYFTAPVESDKIETMFHSKDYYVKKYSQKDNVTWIFVSDWLKKFSEEQQGLKFKNALVINNIIDEELFPFYKRDKELRKKILVVRKFDNICQHSIDQVVRAILELSRRKCFNDLDFDIYGDGDFYDELVEPIRNFSNVHLIRKFIPNNKLGELYKEHGIILLPSRHDAHAVSMGESASTGLVVIGSNVTSNPYFMNEKENHTLTDPEDYVGISNIIEDLYNNPQKFLDISKNMSTFTRQFNKKNTVQKEIKLISDCFDNREDDLLINIRKPLSKPVLTVAVPAYNVGQYLEKCLYSLLNHRNNYKMEILVINDGSKDNTLKIANNFKKLSNGIVKVIDKSNGGHGSTINAAIKEAKGKYFRLVDGDDWVDSDNLANLIDKMEMTDSDIILTKGKYDYSDSALLENIISYDFLVDGKLYKFDDLIYDNYGFKKYGPLLTTGNYKTELLKKAKFLISEKRPYVDMEFNAFSIKYVDTLTYFDIDIYRYLIGREGQSISSEVWKKKYKDHKYIIFNILNKIYADKDFSDNKIEYVLKYIISSMVDSQIFMYDSINKYDELDDFIQELKKYPDAYNYSMSYIEKVNGNCWLILKLYKNWKNKNESIIIPGVRESVNDIIQLKTLKTKQKIKLLVKAITPYGFLVLYRRYKKVNK